LKIFDQKGYIYKKHISTGGEGEVHLIQRDGQLYIAKIFSMMDDDSFQLLKHVQEIQAPNVPKIYDIYNHNDKTILIRDYIDGHTLYEEIEKNKMLTLKRASFVALKICETLKTFHSIKPNPIIYRDLKPENIMISKDGEVFLIDFGIARYHKGESTRDTVLAGTKGYTAPEVMAGMQSDNRSDIYSVGLIFYEMLTGKNLLIPPFQIRPVKESNELIPKWVDKVIEKATEISMVMRYRDITELSDILKNPKSIRRAKTKWVWYCAALVAVIGILVFSLKIFNSEKFQEILDTSVFAIQENAYDTYEIIVDLEFDDIEDFSWMQLVGQKIESGEIKEANFPDLINNGVYTLKCQTIMNYKLVQGSYFHIRVRPEEIHQNGALFFLSFVPELDNMSAYNIPFANKEFFSSDIINEYGYYWEEAQGIPIMVDHKWIDIIVYLDENGETIRYLICDIGNEEDISYGGVRVFDEWIGREYNIEFNIPFEYWENEIGIETPTSQVEFIKYGVGSLKGYLNENLPAYKHNQIQVNDFLDQEIEFIPLDQFTRHEF
jgi:serine/threonine protein kinase